MALEKAKTDSVLGWEVHDHLKSLGLETPMTPDVKMMNKQKLSLIEAVSYTHLTLPTNREV